MKLAILGSRGYPHVYSGYETFVSELAPRLVQRGHEVTVYCHRGLFPVRPREVRGVRLVYIPAVEHKVLSQLSHSFLATLHAAAHRYDAVLFVNAANGPLGSILRAAGTRTAINVDGLEWLRPKWKGLGARYFRWAAQQATRRFDVVITDAQAMADVYRREFMSDSEVIEYGADPTYSTAPERVREFGVSPGEYYLIVGRLVPDNNAELLTRGFEQSRTKRKLLVVGGVPYHDAYVNRVRSTTDERILFPGYVRDQAALAELYANAYVYLHGHEFGGTNPALLRALAAGACVVALDTPFNREMLDGDRLGIYFQKTSASVRETLDAVEADTDRVAQLRAGARQRVIDHYNWTRITDEYERVLDALAQRGRRGAAAW